MLEEKYFDARNNNSKLADHFLNEVGKLYVVEKTAREENFTDEQRFELRKEKSLSVLNELKIWLDETVQATTPSSSIGLAMRYTLNHWEGLIKYLEDGKFEIDNNPVERCIRPVAIGRKNYMFAGSEEGAKNLAMMYSFFGTCKLQEIEPFEWMKTTLEKMPDYDPKIIEELLPLK